MRVVLPPSIACWSTSPCSAWRAGVISCASPEISRVLVCVGHLCECQETGGARALLKELGRAEIEAQETPCLGMCGMGAMGCVEYADGSETLTHGRDQMLDELGIARDEAVECAAEQGADISRILVCTGRMCNREKDGGALLYEALRQQVPEFDVMASPCLGSCGMGSRVCIEYTDGCELTVSGMQATLKKLASSGNGDVSSSGGGRDRSSGGRSGAVSMCADSCAHDEAASVRHESAQRKLEHGVQAAAPRAAHRRAPDAVIACKSDAAHAGLQRGLAAALLSLSLLLASATTATASLPPDTSGTWAIETYLRGQKCSATLMLQPTRAPQSAEETRRGAARYQGVCVEPADGSWVVREGVGGDGTAARLAWRLEYPRQEVYFAFDVEERGGGALGGTGDVYAAPRTDPKAIKRVGDFSARRVSLAWDMQNPVVARFVTEKELPEKEVPDRSTGVQYPF